MGVRLDYVGGLLLRETELLGLMRIERRSELQ